jgi:hypothetical protein
MESAALVDEDHVTIRVQTPVLDDLRARMRPLTPGPPVR